MDKLIRFFKDEEGATAIEYALMLALIAIVIIAAVIYLGEQASETFNNIAETMNRAVNYWTSSLINKLANPI